MLPWGHAAFGYLIYSVYARWQIGHPPIGLAVFALGLGTQFPDLIDKPLTWTIPLLPYGRSLSHSLVTFSVVVLVLRRLTQYPDQRTLVSAFAIGYVSHLVGDSIYPVLTQEYTGLGYWLWPLTSVPEGESRSFIEFFLTLEATPMVVFGGVLTVVSLVVWVYDGLPGVKDLYAEYVQ
ncbi:metal-dependent hydrolase [Halorubrum ezzemoulense]|uniref:metal-dependent hydrolase n=1 Tax=Halorubrum ezzemoulense TaxID=337243 RepID=UPI00232B2786|nr:metal-dependent hydrolase [Halorubrum ezzemoulense]MDB2263700.1 metal-dependent hydrolase [Halorubrum ezzemoulense]